MVSDLVLGVDVGGTHIRLGAVDSDHRIVTSRVIPTSTIVGKGSAIQSLFDQLELFLEESGLAVRGFCLGFPSVVSRDRQSLVQTPNIVGLDNLEVVSLAQSRFRLPVHLERDVNLLLRHDLRGHEAPHLQPVVGVYWGTGVGNAIWSHDGFFVGSTGGAGELGHTPVCGDTSPCGCGNRGCLEAVAGGKRLAAEGRLLYPDTGIDELFTRHGEEPLLRAMVSTVALAVASEMNILDPGLVILGGGVVQMEGFPRARFEAEIREHLRPPFLQQNARFLYSQASPNSGVLGAALHFHDKESHHENRCR